MDTAVYLVSVGQQGKREKRIATAIAVVHVKTFALDRMTGVRGTPCCSWLSLQGVALDEYVKTFEGN